MDDLKMKSLNEQNENVSYEEMKNEYAKRSEKLVKKVKNHNTPQNILLAKTIADSFIDVTKDCYVGRDLPFGYTERMVNKLMTFAYYLGASDIDQRSYTEGYEKARKEMLNFLRTDDDYS